MHRPATIMFLLPLGMSELKGTVGTIPRFKGFGLPLFGYEDQRDKRHRIQHLQNDGLV